MLGYYDGSSWFIPAFAAAFNPYLYCIDVDDPSWSSSYWQGYYDSQSYFSADCATGIDEEENILSNILSNN